MEKESSPTTRNPKQGKEYILLTADGKKVDASALELAYSETLTNLASDVTGKVNEIPLEPTESNPNGGINETALLIILTWIDHQINVGNTPAYMSSPEKVSELSSIAGHTFEPDEWTREYLEKIPTNKLVEVTIAANHLHIPYLLELYTWYEAQQIKGKTPDQIKEIMRSWGALVK